MLKLTVDALIPDRHGIGQGDRNPDQDGFVISIIVAVQAGDKFLFSLVPQPPKNGIVSPYIKQENGQ
jgi:hypothetical protein